MQKIHAGDGIYIQTKHKQTTLRSSRDQQNFPNLSGKVAHDNVPTINPLVAQTIFQRNQGSGKVFLFEWSLASAVFVAICETIDSLFDQTVCPTVGSLHDISLKIVASRT